MREFRSGGPAVVVDDTALTQYLRFAHRLVDASAEAIRPYFRSQVAVDNKAGETRFDPVTAADREAEASIRSLIRQTYPDHGIFGEEHGFEAGTAGLTWVIDPIDGTRAFITGMPLWGTLLALFDGQRPILGIMDQPFTGERFTGSRLGARLAHEGDSRPLSTRSCALLEQAVLQSTHPEMFSAAAESRAFESVATRVQLTRYGGDCYAYCMLAHGLIDLVIESGLNPYDIQALIPIVEAAGGQVTDWHGDDATMGGQVIASGDARVHQQALSLLAPAAGRS
jgi:myo-inositol-1(or 4)-monophosphatase